MYVIYISRKHLEITTIQVNTGDFIWAAKHVLLLLCIFREINMNFACSSKQFLLKIADRAVEYTCFLKRSYFLFIATT